jgi:ribose transport system substrate-binding protein
MHMPAAIRFGRRSRLITAAVVGIALTASLAGCARGSSAAKSVTSDLTIGVVTYDTTAVAAKVETDSAVSYIKKAGWTALSQDAGGDPAKANTICQQYVTRHVDAIAVSVYDWDQMAQCTNAAKSANIPVFFMDSSLVKGMAGAIATSGGAPINKYFISQVKDKPNLQILAFTLQSGAPCRARQADLIPRLKAAGLSGDLTKHEVVVPGQVTDAQAATQAWLNGHPESKGQSLVVWSCFADPATGALSAIRQAGRSDIPIFTWDLTKASVQPLQSGEFAADLAIVNQGPKSIGAQTVGLIKGYIKNKTVKGLTANFTVVTKTNIDAYLKANPQAAS